MSQFPGSVQIPVVVDPSQVNAWLANLRANPPQVPVSFVPGGIGSQGGAGTTFGTAGPGVAPFTPSQSFANLGAMQNQFAAQRFAAEQSGGPNPLAALDAQRSRVMIQNYARVDRNWDAAAFAQFKAQEKAARQDDDSGGMGMPGGRFGGFGRFFTAAYAVREGLRVAQDVRDFSIQSSLAFGNPFAEVQSTLDFNKKISEIPISGQIAGLFVDPFGSRELEIRRAMQTTEASTASAEALSGVSRQTRSLGYQAQAAMLRGDAGARARVEGSYQSGLGSISDQQRAAMDKIEAENADRRGAAMDVAKAQSASPFLINAPITAAIAYFNPYATPDYTEANAAMSSERKTLQNNVRAQRDAEGKIRDAALHEIDWQAQNRGEGYRVGSLQASISGQRWISSTDRAASFFAGAHQKQEEIEHEFAGAAGRKAGTAYINEQNNVFLASEAKLNREQNSSAFQYGNAARANLQRAAGDTYGAGATQAFGHFREQWDASTDPSMRRSVAGSYGTDLVANAIGAFRNASIQAHAYQTDADLAQAQINHDPKSAIDASIREESFRGHQALGAYPKPLQWMLGAGLDFSLALEKWAKYQRFDEETERQQFSLSREVGHLRIMNDMSVDPSVRATQGAGYDIATQAEERANAAHQSGRDSLLPSIAEMARQQLQRVRTEKLDSLEAVEVDPNRMNLSGQGTEDLGKSLSSLDDNLKEILRVLQDLTRN